jgi:hypothetical protein
LFSITVVIKNLTAVCFMLAIIGGVCGDSEIYTDGGGNVSFRVFPFLRRVSILAEKAGREI